MCHIGQDRKIRCSLSCNKFLPYTLTEVIFCRNVAPNENIVTFVEKETKHVKYKKIEEFLLTENNIQASIKYYYYAH